MNSEPRLERIKGGWAARGDGWAVHGATQDEALERYQEAVRRHEEIDRRPLPEEREMTSLRYDDDPVAASGLPATTRHSERAGSWAGPVRTA